MKILRVPLALFLLSLAVRAQDAVPIEPATTVPVSIERTPEELEQLLAPIALYPDALIALILPASTVPTDIVLAARHLQDNPGDRSQIEHRAWDESVKSLTNYPEVLKWMDENLHWTRQVGEAFTVQPADVMQAVQRLRAKARAAGTLVDTQQQQVIAEQQVIRIVPAQPDIIYVPHYQPELVYIPPPIYYTRPFITFGLGVPVGSWLAFDCDWRHNRIWVGNRHRRWTGHDWRRPLVPFAQNQHVTRNVRIPEVRQWRPTQVPRITVTASNRFRTEVARPAPFGLASSRSRSSTFRDSGSSRSNSFRSSGSPNFRSSSPTSRNRTVSTPPVVPALPKNFSPGFRQESVGPQAIAPRVQSLPSLPSLPSARISTPRTIPSRPAATVNVQPPARQSAGTGVRDFGNRSRSFRGSQPNITAPLSVVPALPMTSPARSAQPVGPTMSQRSFSRRPSTPAVVPALPIHNRSAPRAAVGPVAPQVAPQAAAPAPATQAAPARRSGGDFRGHRGASVRR